MTGSMISRRHVSLVAVLLGLLVVFASLSIMYWRRNENPRERIVFHCLDCRVLDSLFMNSTLLDARNNSLLDWFTKLSRNESGSYRYVFIHGEVPIIHNASLVLGKHLALSYGVDIYLFLLLHGASVDAVIYTTANDSWVREALTGILTYYYSPLRDAPYESACLKHKIEYINSFIRGRIVVDHVIWGVSLKAHGSRLEYRGATYVFDRVVVLLDIPFAYLEDNESSTQLNYVWLLEYLYWLLAGQPSFSLASRLVYSENASIGYAYIDFTRTVISLFLEDKSPGEGGLYYTPLLLEISKTGICNDYASATMILMGAGLGDLPGYVLLARNNVLEHALSGIVVPSSLHLNQSILGDRLLPLGIDLDGDNVNDSLLILADTLNLPVQDIVRHGFKTYIVPGEYFFDYSHTPTSGQADILYYMGYRGLYENLPSWLKPPWRNITKTIGWRAYNLTVEPKPPSYIIETYTWPCYPTLPYDGREPITNINPYTYSLAWSIITDNTSRNPDIYWVSHVLPTIDYWINMSKKIIAENTIIKHVTQPEPLRYLIRTTYIHVVKPVVPEVEKLLDKIYIHSHTVHLEETNTTGHVLITYLVADIWRNITIADKTYKLHIRAFNTPFKRKIEITVTPDPLPQAKYVKAEVNITTLNRIKIYLPARIPVQHQGNGSALVMRIIWGEPMATKITIKIHELATTIIIKPYGSKTSLKEN